MSEEIYDEISLQKFIKTLINEKFLITIIFMIVFLISAIFSFYQYNENKNSKLIVCFNFENINSDKNLEPINIDPYKIAAPYILADVIENLNLKEKISPNSIRSLINITAIIPEEVSSKIENENFEYIPNEYQVVVNTSKEYNIDGATAQKIANQIVLSYTEYFKNEYILKPPIINKLATFDSSKYDYSDISIVLHNQLKEIKDYNYSLSLENINFRSKKTGMAFLEIVNLVNNTNEIDLNKLDSIISSHKLTKDNTRLLESYEYLISQLEYKRNKLKNQANIKKSMLSSMEDSSNSVFNTLTNPIEKPEESYFNKLILETSEISTNINDINESIAYYKTELENLKSGKYIVEYDRDLVKKDVENLILKITNDLLKWINLSENTSDELYDQYLSNSFYALSPAIIDNSSNPLLNLSIGFFLGIMLGIFIVIFKTYWNNENRRNYEN